MSQKLDFKVLIEQDEDGFFVASVPALPGCHTQGKTLEETLINIKDVIKLCLDVAKENPGYAQKVNLTSTPTFFGVTNVKLNHPYING